MEKKKTFKWESSCKICEGYPLDIEIEGMRDEINRLNKAMDKLIKTEERDKQLNNLAGENLKLKQERERYKSKNNCIFVTDLKQIKVEAKQEIIKKIDEEYNTGYDDICIIQEEWIPFKKKHNTK